MGLLDDIVVSAKILAALEEFMIPLPDAADQEYGPAGDPGDRGLADEG